MELCNLVAIAKNNYEAKPLFIRMEGSQTIIFVW
ncbi:hypothetical protein C8N47_101218 [Mangrovibacterium marinum]|uniref:Uncharacterized protein n=1 Tax=Mangrovibacterium marinum TaxID=1639118 RepID=A0A2T5C6J2_9BACT|nr:hypothetical protein C8N47_101218 [Mangrovibacterium marinum]